MLCPACGARARRSHTRGTGEKLFKLISRNKIYRCRKCEWRGWLSQGRRINVRQAVRRYTYFTIVLIVTVMIALYYAHSLSVPGNLVQPE